MKPTQFQMIENEEWEVRAVKEELEKLKSKLIKLPHTVRFISFLEFFIEQKKEFINKLKVYDTNERRTQ